MAQLWLQAGGAAVGLTQSQARHAGLQQLGVTPRLGNPVELLTANDALLLSLPGHATQLQAIELLVKRQTPRPQRVALISTVGYYGPNAAGTITEETPPGQDARSASIAATERAFSQWAGRSGVALRLGGLYNARRGPLPALARRGAPKLRPPNKTLALIHYDDAAAAVVAALQHPAPAPVYLAVTPPCPSREEFYRLACQKLNLPDPQFAEPLATPPAEYDIRLLRRDLLPTPAYPDWRAALEPEVRSEGGPRSVTSDQ